MIRLIFWWFLLSPLFGSKLKTILRRSSNTDKPSSSVIPSVIPNSLIMAETTGTNDDIPQGGNDTIMTVGPSVIHTELRHRPWHFKVGSFPLKDSWIGWNLILSLNLITPQQKLLMWRGIFTDKNSPVLQGLKRCLIHVRYYRYIRTVLDIFGCFFFAEIRSFVCQDFELYFGNDFICHGTCQGFSPREVIFCSAPQRQLLVLYDPNTPSPAFVYPHTIFNYWQLNQTTALCRICHCTNLMLRCSQDELCLDTEADMMRNSFTFCLQLKQMHKIEGQWIKLCCQVRSGAVLGCQIKEMTMFMLPCID